MFPYSLLEAPLTPAQKLLSWYTRRNPIDLWLDLLHNAESFEEWEEAALHLDSLLGLDLWSVANPPHAPENQNKGTY